MDDFSDLFRSTTAAMEELLRMQHRMIDAIHEVGRVMDEHGLAFGPEGLTDPAYEAEVAAAEWLDELPPSPEVFYHGRENA